MTQNAMCDIFLLMRFDIEKVRQLMHTRGFSQEQFAERMGITRQAVNAVLSGRHNASLKTITTYASVLSVSADTLLKKDALRK